MFFEIDSSRTVLICCHIFIALKIARCKVLAAIDTAVILMGTIKLAVIADALMSGGKAPSTPVAIVSWANTPRQRVIKGRLDEIAAVAASVKPTLSPAIIIVGAVARHARE